MRTILSSTELKWFGFFIALLSFSITAAVAEDTVWDLHSDSWVAVDALGRELPSVDVCGPVKNNKTVGIFYWTWHNLHGRQGPFDNTKILAGEGEWGPLTAPHHWGEPELGYYISTDPYVIRKHASMLVDAGVDVIIFDTTNPPFTFYESYMALCKTYKAMRDEGNRTPQIAFLCPFGNPYNLVKTLYSDFYSKGIYKDLWFLWYDKPLIMADPEPFKETEIGAFFTFRKPIPSYFTGPDSANQWGWLEVFPQHSYYDGLNRVEQVTVGVAQNAADGKLAPMSHKNGAYGRSWHDGKKDTRKDAVLYGLNLAEQWERALEINPPFVFVTGWNEWVAGRYSEWNGYSSEDVYLPNAVFVDQYTQEYSRDIEPMKGGHTDNYYYELISYIRRFKGMHEAPKAGVAKTIEIDGQFDEWGSIEPEYRDTIGDTAFRDHKGYGKTHYTNKTGRNDIIRCKMSYDDKNVYAYVETLEAISPSTDKAWMLLYLNVDQDYKTGWEGYDFVVNMDVFNDKRTKLMAIDGSDGRFTLRLASDEEPSRTIYSTTMEDGKLVLKTNVQAPVNADYSGLIQYRVAGNKAEFAIPRKLLGLDGKSAFTIDFHWADNTQKMLDITEFAISGDSAPNRRFNYRYQVKP